LSEFLRSLPLHGDRDDPELFRGVNSDEDLKEINGILAKTVPVKGPNPEGCEDIGEESSRPSVREER
jgi:hypothetical protein